MKKYLIFSIFLIILNNSLSSLNNKRKIYAAGSGLDMLSLPETVKEILELSGISKINENKPNILYIGTATYDNPSPRITQTKGFINEGCSVDSLDISYQEMDKEIMNSMFEKTDIILVSGGNTLFAVDRWRKTGVDLLIKKASEEGKVLCGGSAGGIVWFDGGHSDSMEPGSYKNPPGPILNENKSEEVMNNWAYIRAPGLGIINGLFCPHYDMVEGNGELRSKVFTAMLQQHSGEYGISVDNWAALRIEGNNYKVISREGKKGSVDANGNYTDKSDGRPGSWIMSITTNGKLNRTLVKEEGLLSDISRKANYISEDMMLNVARRQNPDDGKMPDWMLKSETEKLFGLN